MIACPADTDHRLPAPWLGDKPARELAADSALEHEHLRLRGSLHTLLLRPARPQDSVLAQRFIQGLSARSQRRRFHGRLPALGAAALAGRDSIAHPPHQAWVALLHDGPQVRMVGDVRFVRDGDGRDAEFGLVVCDSLHRQGLGRALMLALLHHAARRGVRWLRGEVHLDNPAMLSLMLSLGFRPARCDEAAGLMVFETRLPPVSG